jgi:ketosteroid isomerase-like protein
MSERHDHVATVGAIYEAFGRGDVPSILEQLDEGVAWDHDAPSHGVPIYEPRTGRAAVAEFFAALQDLEFLRFAPTNFLVGGNQVAVTIDLEVKVRATGRSVSALEVHLWTFDDETGKITRFFHAVDRHAFVVAYQD